MAQNKTITVGVFAEKQSDGNAVPASMVGRKIFYNSDYEFFIVADENSKYSSRFSPDKFLQFVEVDAIVFSNETVGKNLIDECRRLIQPGEHTQQAPGNNQYHESPSPAGGQGKQLQPGGNNASYNNEYNEPNDEYEQWDNDYEEDYESAPTYNHAHGTPDSEDVRPSASAKDPTAHLTTFFVATLAITVIFSIVVLFGFRLISALQPLVS